MVIRIGAVEDLLAQRPKPRRIIRYFTEIAVSDDGAPPEVIRSFSTFVGFEKKKKVRKVKPKEFKVKQKGAVEL